MKKLKFLVGVKDAKKDERYEKGQEVEFEDERADEILSKSDSSGNPYAEEFVEVEENDNDKEVDTSKMTRDQLVALAAEMGIETTKEHTKANIIELMQGTSADNDDGETQDNTYKEAE